MDLGVKGRSYILVGGTKGMGYEAGKLLAAEGAKVTLVSRTADHAQAQAQALVDAYGCEAIGLAADATQPGALDEAVATSIARFGPPRGLLASNGHTARNGDLLSMTDDDWRHNFDDVLMGQVRACRAVLPAMLANGGGQIVTTAAYSARAPKDFLFAYASLKAALINFTKNMAKTYGARGIRANCVCPGAVATQWYAERLAAVMADNGMERAAASAHIMKEVFKMPVGLGRPGEAHEGGEMMAFALSERAGYMTGAIINVDGGTDF